MAAIRAGAKHGWTSIFWHTRANNAQARKLYDRSTEADDFVRYRLAIG